MKTNCTALCLALASAAAFAVFGESADVDALRREIADLRARCEKAKLPLGVADEFGVYHLTPEGKKVDELEQRLTALTGGGADPLEAGRRAGWGTTPLGPRRSIKVPKTFAKKPALGGHPARRPGVRLFGGGAKASVVCAERDRGAFLALADEFAWHLSQMTGEPFSVVESAPVDGAAVVFGGAETAGEFGVDLAALPDDAAVVKRKGDRLFVGGKYAGASQALTYVLESMGCRYLWPGKLGKFIPRRDEVVLPEIDLVHVPQLEMRAIREGAALGTRHGATTAALGFDREAFEKRQLAANCDRPGNRSFWHWHGVNDGRGTPGQLKGPGKYKWGHYFKDYIDRYMETHPEWFALQADGSRRQGEKERPCFCLTNEGLIQESIDNLVRDFAENPGAVALSACLPDGGHSSPCMCERCRRLDSPDAEPRTYRMYVPKTDEFRYVGMTDRVFWFMNRLADGVAARLPGKKLTTYAYSYYTDPPCWVRPSTNLVVLSVAGDYVNAYPRRDGGDSRGYARENMSAWSSFGNPLLWRPNCIRGFNCVIPQNCARRMFEDLETFKANGTIGTDFDCNDEQWAIKGLAFYMTAKAHLNIDRLDYDTLLDDYCAAFGGAKGAAKEFFLELERTTEAAADARCGIVGYVDFFDPAPFEAILARAERDAGDDEMALRRVAFLKVGLEYAKCVKRNKRATDAKSPKLMEYLREYRALMHRMYRNDDTFVAVNPRRIGFYDHWLRPLVVEGQKRLASVETNGVYVSFARGRWSRDDFIPVKSFRWDEVCPFVQKDDCIVNRCPDVPGEEVYRKYHSSVYAALVYRRPFAVGSRISSTMMFDHRMAPIVVIADGLGKNAKTGHAEFRDHWEVCLYDQGVNVWRHFFEDGQQKWYKAGSLVLPEREYFRPNVRHEVKVTVENYKHGSRQIVVSVGGYTLTCVDDHLPDTFFAGIIACEGRNFFYDFKAERTKR